MDTAPDPLLTERFRADLARVWPGWSDETAILGLAVSGGSDSLAMLLLAQAALPGRVAVATVDHGLRADSAGEVAFVIELCRSLGVPATGLAVTVGPGNVQAGARDARYAALAQWAGGRVAAVATAHHGDDQLETLVMRLNRGAGLSGLAAIRARRGGLADEVPVLRPLLGWRKSELEGIVARAGIDPVRDPSNTDMQFDRPRIRKRLAGVDWLDVAAIAKSLDHLAEAEEEIVNLCTIELSGQVSSCDNGLSYRPLAGQYLRKRVVQMIFAQLGKDVGLSQISDLVLRLEAGGQGNLAGILASSDDGLWTFSPEPPRRGALPPA